MSEPIKTQPVKVPLEWAAKALADVCQKIDENDGEVDAKLDFLFKDTSIALAESVDRRIAFNQYLEGLINASNEAKKAWHSRTKKLQEVQEKFKEKTKQIVEAQPDIPFKGSLGHLKIQSNSTAALDLTFDDKNLSPELIDMFGIDSERFVTVETTYTLNTSAVKAALESGEDIPWAKLNKGKHLRGWK